MSFRLPRARARVRVRRTGADGRRPREVPAGAVTAMGSGRRPGRDAVGVDLDLADRLREPLREQRVEPGGVLDREHGAEGLGRDRRLVPGGVDPLPVVGADAVRPGRCAACTAATRSAARRSSRTRSPARPRAPSASCRSDIPPKRERSKRSSCLYVGCTATLAWRASGVTPSSWRATLSSWAKTLTRSSFCSAKRDSWARSSAATTAGMRSLSACSVRVPAAAGRRSRSTRPAAPAPGGG